MPGGDQYGTFQKLTAILLLTYALRNADCHSKNLALLYTSRDGCTPRACVRLLYDFGLRGVPEQSARNQFHGEEDVVAGKDSGNIHYFHFWRSSTRAEGNPGTNQ